MRINKINIWYPIWLIGAIVAAFLGVVSWWAVLLMATAGWEISWTR